MNPRLDPWIVPHSCGQTCDKLLQNPSCGHRCLLLCHPGKPDFDSLKCMMIVEDACADFDVFKCIFVLVS